MALIAMLAVVTIGYLLTKTGLWASWWCCPCRSCFYCTRASVSWCWWLLTVFTVIAMMIWVIFLGTLFAQHVTVHARPNHDEGETVFRFTYNNQEILQFRLGFIIDEDWLPSAPPCDKKDYDVLEVPYSASSEQIKEAFHRLARATYVGPFPAPAPHVPGLLLAHCRSAAIPTRIPIAQIAKSGTFTSTTPTSASRNVSKEPSARAPGKNDPGLGPNDASSPLSFSRAPFMSSVVYYQYSMHASRRAPYIIVHSDPPGRPAGIPLPSGRTGSPLASTATPWAHRSGLSVNSTPPILLPRTSDSSKSLGGLPHS
jgi:hypothetical protein